jgi:hypothetical protein
MSLGYDAKGENRSARLIRHFHPQFRTSFNGMVQVAEYFTGGSCGFQLNRAYVGKLDPVVVVRCVVPMANAKKVFRHPEPLAVQYRGPVSRGANHGLSVQNSSLLRCPGAIQIEPPRVKKKSAS